MQEPPRTPFCQFVVDFHNRCAAICIDQVRCHKLLTASEVGRQLLATPFRLLEDIDFVIFNITYDQAVWRA